MLCFIQNEMTELALRDEGVFVINGTAKNVNLEDFLQLTIQWQM